MNMYNLKCLRGVVDFTEMFWSFSQKSVGSIVRLEAKAIDGQ
jgi:hypothetical protein